MELVDRLQALRKALGSALNAGGLGSIPPDLLAGEMESTRRYPMWYSRVKCKGRRDASQRSRSNRRKAQRRRRG